MGYQGENDVGHTFSPTNQDVPVLAGLTYGFGPY